MIHQKINNKKWTVNHNFPFVHLLSSPIRHTEFIIIIIIIIILIYLWQQTAKIVQRTGLQFS